jgi:hypothetical protein
MTRLRRFLAMLGISTVMATAHAEMPIFDQTPDAPEAFGYKVNWFSVKTNDLASVVNTLELGPAIPEGFTQ